MGVPFGANLNALPPPTGFSAGPHPSGGDGGQPARRRGRRRLPAYNVTRGTVSHPPPPIIPMAGIIATATEKGAAVMVWLEPRPRNADANSGQNSKGAKFDSMTTRMTPPPPSGRCVLFSHSMVFQYDGKLGSNTTMIIRGENCDRSPSLVSFGGDRDRGDLLDGGAGGHGGPSGEGDT